MKTRNSTSTELLKWSAQAIGFFTTGSLIIFTFTEVFPAMKDGRANMVVPLLPLLTLGIVGYFLSFQRELAGGTMLLAGGSSAVLYILLMIRNEQAALILGVPLVMTGILYLVHWLLLYRKHHGHHARR